MPQIVLSHSPAKLHGIRDENARLVSHLTLKPLASASAFQADIATHDRVLDWAQTNCTLRRLRTEREVLAANLRMHRRIQAIAPSRDVVRKQHAAAFEASRALVSQISAAKWGPACTAGTKSPQPAPMIDRRRPWNDRFPHSHA